MVMPKPHDDEAEREAWRERIRQMPGVIVHRGDPSIPYVPWIQVTGDVDIHELLGRSDDDWDDDQIPCE